MSNDAVTETKNPPVLYNPWVFIPLLYFMQAIPVTIVQEVAAIFYKDLGFENEPIVRWTSLISLPWSLQLLFGPLVDLNSTKRNWILGGQFLIAIGLGATALLLSVPHAFEITLLILGATAVTSALCNIATDGFYILSTTKDQQAKFVGVQTTCYRLGRLFCSGLLVLFVGLLMRFPDLPVVMKSGRLAFNENRHVALTDKANLSIRDGMLADSKLGILQPQIKVPSGTYGLRLATSGEVFARVGRTEQSIGRLSVCNEPEYWPAKLDDSPPVQPAAEGQVTSTVRNVEGTNPVFAWTIILLAATGIYLCGHFVNRFKVPKPAADVRLDADTPGENIANIQRTLVLLGIGLSGFFFFNALVRLIAHGLWATVGGGTATAGTAPGALDGWKLPQENLIVGFNLGLGGPGTEVLQAAVCGAILLGSLILARNLIRGTTMAEALGSYVRQPGFPAILFFILFYRFGEAMVGKMSALFLKDSIEMGGLAVANEHLGKMNGLGGVLGIVLGGLVGGLVVSRIGLRKAFWPLAFAMHVPNLMYVWASSGVYVPPSYIYGILFVDQFGYGFGFAGYMVYLMWVAQRGQFKTTHFAIGTGMGALCIAIAGVVSGILQKNFGYHTFFIAVIFMSIPGLLSLLFIPLDESHKQIKVEVE